MVRSRKLPRLALEFAIPWRGPNTADKVEAKHINILPHSGLLEDLRKDPTAAVRILRHEADNPAKATRDIIQFGSYLCAIHVYAVGYRKQDLLVDAAFLDALWRIVQDQLRYDLVDPESHGAGNVPFLVISMHLLMRLLKKALEAFCALKLDYRERAVQSREETVLHMSRCRAFWGIVWEYHYDLMHHGFHDHIYLAASGPKGGSLRSAVIDCLIAMEAFVDHIIGTHLAHQEAMDAYLVAWICASSNNLSDQDRILGMLASDLRILSKTPGEIASWFTSVDQRDYCTAEDVVGSLRAILRSRRSTCAMVRGALYIFLHLATHPIMQTYTMNVANHPGRPLHWVMKAIQRQLCVRAGDPEVTKGELAAVGLGSLITWCGVMHLDAVHIVSYKFGLPIIPYLSHFAIYTSKEAHPELATPLGDLIMNCAETARVHGHPGEPLPFAKSGTMRRIWITTLQQLRTYTGSPIHTKVVDLWMALGRIYGYNERLELARLKKPIPTVTVEPDEPTWSRCAWTGCMCHEQRPLYRLAACKGCLRAYYCGKECQENDWTSGHSEHCRRP